LPLPWREGLNGRGCKELFRQSFVNRRWAERRLGVIAAFEIMPGDEEMRQRDTHEWKGQSVASDTERLRQKFLAKNHLENLSENNFSSLMASGVS